MKIIDINKYCCEGCRKELKIEDAPYLFRSIEKLCNRCKKIAYLMLTKKRETI